MNRFGLLITAIFIFFKTSAQKVEKFYTWEWKECKSTEARFFSLIEKKETAYFRNDFFINEKRLQMSGYYEDANCKIPNGKFYYFHANGNLEREGNYLHGKKNGLWLSYHNNKMLADSTYYDSGDPVGTSVSWFSDGFISDSAIYNADGSSVYVSWFDNGAPSSAGRYVDGSYKNGTWQYFHKNGVRSALEKYEYGKLLTKQYYAEDGLQIDDTSNNDRNAEFPKGTKGWDKYMNKNLYFPSDYKIINADEAIVVVSFAINESGEVEDIIVTNPFFPVFDKIVLDAIRKSPKWIAARQHNRNVKYKVNQSVNFKSGTTNYSFYSY
jgi:antitoxin component YwqK of YwqJK toxin-antitoxin module